MLQRSSPLPLYHQLKQLLIDRIEQGDWKPGDLIPGEHELQATYELSRTTVRQAMQELEREGFVTRHRGRGTFVAHPRVVHSPEPRTSVSEYLIAQGLRPGWRVLAAEIKAAPPDVAARLRLPPGSPVFCSRRVRLADGDPIGYLVAHVPAGLVGVLDRDRLAVGGSLDYLRDRGALRGTQIERSLEAAGATELEGQLLGLAVGAPVLKIYRLVVAPDGQPIEDFTATYRGDRFRYRVAATCTPAPP